MAEGTLKEVVALAERFSSADFDKPNKEFVQLETQIAHLEKMKKGSFFGVEAAALRTISSRLVEHQSKRDFAKKELEDLKKVRVIGDRYQRLSLEPLKWRDGQGFPKLVVFSLNRENFSIFSSGTIEPSSLPQAVIDCYRDVLNLLREMNGRKQSFLRLRCEFQGLIPVEVKSMINDAQPFFGDQIFIIAEPKDFSLTEISRPKSDPLVVGYTPLSVDSLWLIAEFDTTSVEEAMIAHFDTPQ